MYISQLFYMVPSLWFVCEMTSRGSGVHLHDRMYSSLPPKLWPWIHTLFTPKLLLLRQLCHSIRKAMNKPGFTEQRCPSWSHSTLYFLQSVMGVGGGSVRASRPVLCLLTWSVPITFSEYGLLYRVVTVAHCWKFSDCLQLDLILQVLTTVFKNCPCASFLFL